MSKKERQLRNVIIFGLLAVGCFASAGYDYINDLPAFLLIASILLGFVMVLCLYVTAMIYLEKPLMKESK